MAKTKVRKVWAVFNNSGDLKLFQSQRWDCSSYIKHFLVAKTSKEACAWARSTEPVGRVTISWEEK